jgi:outer membrane receptor protein involved in Fe transport
VFLIDWKDIQLNAQTPVWGYYVTINAGKAQSKGMELELSGKIGNALRYGLGYSYTDAKLTEDARRPYAPYVLIAPSDSRLPAVPKNVINGSLEYGIRLTPQLALTPHVDAYRQSGTFNQLAATQAAAIALDGYTIWNTSVALAADTWSVTLACRNVTNEKAISGVFTEASFGSAPAAGFAGNTSRQLITTPRTIGMILKYHF